MLPVTEQLALIERSADQVVPKEELLKKLTRSVATGKPLRIKYGIDPTGIDVHLGHTVPLRKLRLFQELGHQAVLIIGNYTALVGDPSGKDETRAGLTEQQVEANAQDYLKQIAKIVDVSKAEVHRNGDWFAKWNFLDTMRLCGQITVQRMLERDDFTKRVRSGTPISLHECLYPLMQGRDSVEIKADVELGGSEQLFNLMVGRKLQGDAGQESQVCLTLPILRGLDGVRRMGKSLGNYIGVGEPANEQFGKTMSIPDALLSEWFDLLTDRPKAEIAAMIAENPMNAKKTLGKDIVAFYYGAAAASEAQAEWERRFSGRQDPTDIPFVDVARTELVENAIAPNKLLVLVGFAKSNTEGRQRITEGAMSIGPDRTKVTDPMKPMPVEDGLIVRLGSKKIAKIRLV